LSKRTELVAAGDRGWLYLDYGIGRKSHIAFSDVNASQISIDAKYGSNIDSLSPIVYGWLKRSFVCLNFTDILSKQLPEKPNADS
jgi:hypothetical protein